ncbi:MAG: Gfo/Idh/MocA family oxidoreductase [Opitutaceae bacterium]|nr:Gfo/Idh/MocA family oxidoreductase [Opitutaceae bacterium]
MSSNYDLKASSARAAQAPELDYSPPKPDKLVPKIGMIACGGITEHHCKAYVAAGWDVVAFYDRNKEKAEKRQRAFYPDARICDTVGELLAIPEINVVDIATHPDVRGPLIEAAIRSGKHILSQKPFVLDLKEGERLVESARAAGVSLAVNQNGRWAPYFHYLRKVVRSGLIGEVGSVSISINWDHTWTAGTAFESIHHLVLYDFGIHWFDAAFSFFGGAPAKSVFATVRQAPGQPIKPPLLATAIVAFDTGIATLNFNGCSCFSQLESCTIIGSKGTLRAVGGVCSANAIEVTTEAGTAKVDLQGAWFHDGFRGTMGELLRSVEQGRDPENSAADNLRSLAICFGAMKSADEGRIVAL